MSLVAEIQPGEMGCCHVCGTYPATRPDWTPFDPPLAATLREDGTELFPAVVGVWAYVCDDCPANEGPGQ